MPSKSGFDSGATPRPSTSTAAGQTTSGTVTAPTGAPVDDRNVNEWVVDLPSTGQEPTGGEITTVEPYQTAMRDDYREVRQWAKDKWGFGSVADVDARTKWAADKFKDQYGRYPSATELWSYQPYQDTLGLLASGGAYMEPYFGIRNADGSTTWVHNSGVEWSATDEKAAWFGSGGDELANMMTAGFRAPSYTDAELGLILESLSPVSTGGRGGGGGGGGAGRAEMVFDRAKLAEEVTNRWRGMLLEEPDDATRNKIVNGYITDANGFWMNEAGQLDFDTYVVDKIRAQDRYTFLYEKKPEFQSEAEYMSGFRNTVAGFGMNDRATLREVEAGAHSGAGLQGFGERVSRTAEVRAATGGSYSQRFASTMAQSGLGRT